VHDISTTRDISLIELGQYWHSSSADLLADSHSILSRWKNYFVRYWMYIRVGQAVIQPNSSEIETAVEKLKMYKSSGIDQIPAESI
jgi:hypothetical protein